MSESTIGVRELRADLAAHVRRAAAGQRVVVSVGGRETAQLGPVHSLDGQIVLADLVTAGLVVAPRRTDAARAAQAIPVWSGVRLDRALKELRG